VGALALVLVLALAAALPLLAVLAYLAWQVRWMRERTLGTAYYGRSLAGRRAYKEELLRRSRRVVPLVKVLAAVRKPAIPTCEYKGIRGPGMACTRETFRRTEQYAPEPGDVFVATQMKCGTTWMQQVVYEVLSRGRGDLSDAGHGHLYRVSPWIEAKTSVSLEDAPRIGASKSRIIKTHMPVQLTPWSPAARYVYVTREPLACLASCMDFIRMLTGPAAWDDEGFVDWFCSERMWWGPWPAHVAGWWSWAQERPNVLFVHYEQMRRDLPAVVSRVAAFLDVELGGEELAEVVRKSSFDYMKAHEELFEMAPPSLFSVAEGSFFVSGGRERTGGLDPAARERVLAFCREGLKGSSYPAGHFYPELAGQGAATPPGSS
jgi:hypothetical protein